MSWIKLKRGNDWETQYLTLGRTNCYRDALLFTAGEEVDVRFPDGTVARRLLVMKTEYGSYSDHGRETETKFTIPHVIEDVHGVAVALALDSLEVDHDWAKGREPKP